MTRGQKALYVWDYLLAMPVNSVKPLTELNFKSNTGKELFIEATKLYIDLGIDQRNGFVVEFNDGRFSKIRKFRI